MIALFNLDSVNRSAAAFNQDKLQWLNQHYIKTQDPSSLVKPFSDQLDRLGLNHTLGPNLEDVISAQAERCNTLVEMAEKSRYFFEDFTDYDEKAAKKNLKVDVKAALKTLRQRYAQVTQWEAQAVHQILLEVATEYDLKLGKLAQPVRVAVTGGSVSPPLDITLALIGRQRVLERLQRAVDWIAD